MRSKSIVLVLLFWMTVIIPALGVKGDILFHTSNLIDVRNKGLHNPRTPVKPPSASLNDHTLYIEDATGCTLQLVQDDEIVYSTVI